MDKTTARMTKDLYGYNDYFADELDALIGKRTTELAPLYRRLQKTAVDRLEELNKELETVPEAKRKSKRVQIKMQEQYVAQILPDLELALAAQDPYVTEVLHGTFEYGYYTQAYSLEQATQVAVNVPILNRAGVLGLIANDWVGDGHTYSDRIRASTALVATNAEKTIKNLVTKRLSYNEAANELKDAIDESYNNAIRIVRTEMTRANGLGASYAAMENADILDGKYRDAVRDKRTSGMCAVDADYSIKKPYPLDYDTPANPGVPGKRIPNHPNCRCNWRMVLSAIGIRNRSQLARKNDSKESYGERYYTEAKTYDAYAKERGLPSVKEMLEKDNPKRYLRPGETLESLNKKVKRVKVNGKTVTVSKAAWDKDGTYGISVPQAINTTNNVGAIANVQNSDIINGVDVSIIKAQNWTTTVQTDGVDEVLDFLSKSNSPEAVAFWNKYGHLVQGDFYDTSTLGHYSPATRRVHLNLDNSDPRSTRIGAVKDVRLFFHETGHLFDDTVLPGTSVKANLPDLRKKLRADAVAYINQIAAANNSTYVYKTVSNIAAADRQAVVRDLLTDKDLKNAISDIMGGLTNCTLQGGYGHNKSYWHGTALEDEAIAHMFECTMLGGERLAVFKKYFPTAYDYFITYLKTLL